ncbi:hypothetical protein IWX81_002946 [Salinibacterium sp. CAN_S4]|uniref:DUF4097 family beta strand repeat-containing protein n=1 Tax=Salinibacterium sp. CAN_S4 TaxID=2787727 RepID=UPI0018EFE40D
MPRFDTPAPIDLSITVQVGLIEVIASDRVDTIVTVSPTNRDRAVDVRAAHETAVTFDGGRLTVTSPRPRFTFIGPSESVDVTVELPTGSRLTAEIAVGNLRSSGQLGATRVKSSTGAVVLDRTGDLWVRVSHGSATVAAADGSAEITADHGQIRIGEITGDSTFKSSHGNVTVGTSGGDLEAKLSYGDLDVEKVLGSAASKSAYGTIRLGEISSGAVDVETGFGQIAIGVRPGVPAWLDLSSKSGHVRNQLDDGAAPGETESSVAVRAHTQFGDVTIERASQSATQ